MAADPLRKAGGPHTRAAAARTHALFDGHARMVYGLCRALLRDVHEADDATQATFVAAFRSLLGGTEPLDEGAWLAAIARNECAARARARMREPLPLVDLEIAVFDGPEAELARRDAVEELRQAIAGLPERQREAVVLRDLYGLHYAEVGAALGLSVPSVESLLFRARRQLRVSLKPLAGGALTLPLAVREGVAQAVPALGTAGAPSGALGLGVLAKLSTGPVAMKMIAGAAAAVTAGTIAVAGVEHSRGGPSSAAEAGVVGLAPGAAAALAEAPARTPARVAVARSRSAASAHVGLKIERDAAQSGREDDDHQSSQRGSAGRENGSSGADGATPNGAHADDEDSGGGNRHGSTRHEGQVDGNAVEPSERRDDDDAAAVDASVPGRGDETDTWEGAGHDEQDSGSSSEDGEPSGSGDGREDGSASESPE